ncbi:ATP-dependent DNA ligase [Streptomyces sp. SID13666]|uniref:ATP-dependent DNA ligase n=1 Tax=Streptomyces sp. SID13666 TaxID=2706054 RepID=UPI001EF39DF1|nr:ATP-dependent DNA ligase [Streptomyces sp. SID13666]
MRPAPATVLPAESGWRFDVKCDGWRAQADVRHGSVLLRSRRGTDIGPRFPELVTALAELPDGVTLDGEVVAAASDGSLDFLALQRTARARAAARLEVLFVAFDVLTTAGPDGQVIDCRAQPLRVRAATLDAILLPLAAGSRVQKVASTTSREQALEWLAVLPEGLEGIVCKRLVSPYDPRNARSWIKVRTADTIDLPVVGIVGTPRRPTAVVVLASDGPRATSPRLESIQAADVAAAVAGHLTAPSRVRALDDAMVYPVMGAPLAEVRAGHGRHGSLRFLRMRDDV